MTRQMKDSGVEWIGEIPEDWEVYKLKYLGFFSASGIDKKIKADESKIKIVNYVDIYHSREKLIRNADYMEVTASRQKIEENNLVKGDALFTPSSETIEEIGYSAIVDENLLDTSYSYHLLRFRFTNTIEHNYKRFIFNNIALLNQFASEARGTTRKTLNRIDFEEAKIPLPPRIEQSAIANFLDRKTKEIDTIIANSKQAIEAYKRYKQALITKVITKGLDKNNCLKDSGIDWIGAIPENWETAKLKYLVKQPLKYGANSSGCEYKEELPRYIRITDISKDNKLIDTGKLSIDLNEKSEFILQDGDILFARSGATVGKTFFYKEEMGLSGFAGYLIRARINDDNLSKYIYYITLSSYYEKWKDSILIQATIENIGADKYNNLIVTVPPIKKQEEIVTYLDEKTRQIDEIISKKEKLVEEMEAYKKSLIFETVTGKREVD